jgi:hypothetical protein
MTWLTAIFRAAGALLSEILPVLLEHLRRPRRVEQVGSDPELRKDVSASIEEDLDKKGR